MNKITVTNAQITNMKIFHARGGYGIDVYLKDDINQGTVYFQTTLYDENASAFQRKFAVGDRIDITGTLKTMVYKKKTDGSETISNVIINPQGLTNLSEKTNQQYQSSPQWDAMPAPPSYDETFEDDLPF